MIKKSNDNAMTVAAIAFGVFCLFVVVAGIIFIVSVTSQSPQITDTYGTAPSPITNTSRNLVTNETATAGNAMIPIILIGGVVLLIAVLFAFWVFSKGIKI